MNNTATNPTTNPNLSIEDQRKLESVKELLRLSKEPVDKVKLEDVARFERQAGMKPHEKLEDSAKEDRPYKDSQLQQHFSCIKSIKAIRGYIYMDINEDVSLKDASLEAFRVLGPLASDDEVKKYIADHQIRCTLLTVPKFLRNLKFLVHMVRTAPEFFGASRGGGAVRDIVADGLGAVRDALEYLRLHQNSIPPQLYKLWTEGSLETSKHEDFVKHLGVDYRSVLATESNLGRANEVLIRSKNLR